METLLTAALSFAITNVDDLLLLLLFFAQATTTKARWQIVVGQYLGFCALLLASLPGFFGRALIDPAWLGWLGLLPIAIGIRHVRRPAPDDDIEENAEPREPTAPKTVPHFLVRLLGPLGATVAAVTVANGGDNIGVYAPLFSSLDRSGLFLTLGVYLGLVAVWCLTAQRLAGQAGIAHSLRASGRLLVPLALIALGLVIITRSGALGLLAR